MMIPNSVYICGPMSGLPEFNYTAFHEAAKELRGYGYTVLNPAEINADAVAVRRPWADCLRRDLAELVKCEHIFTLPGWQESKGATLEMFVAMRLRINWLNAHSVELVE